MGGPPNVSSANRSARAKMINNSIIKIGQDCSNSFSLCLYVRRRIVIRPIRTANGHGAGPPLCRRGKRQKLGRGRDLPRIPNGTAGVVGRIESCPAHGGTAGVACVINQ